MSKMVQPTVGIEPVDRLEWAVNFAQQAEPVTTRDWLNLRRSVDAFANSLVWWDRVPGSVRGELQRHYSHGVSCSDGPSVRVVRKIRKAFGDILGKLERSGRYTQTLPRTIWFAAAEPKEWIERFGHANAAYWRYPRYRFTRGWIKDALLHFLDLLAGPPGELLRICPEQHSRRFFVASRPNQEFCSTKCQNRAAQREHRARK